MSKLIGISVVTLAVLSISIHVTAQGEGKGKGRRGPGAVGKVTSVDQEKKTFVIETRDGSKTVATSSSTEFSKRASGKIGDIKEKDHIMAMGAMSEDKQTIDAMRIMVITQGAGERRRDGKGKGPGGGERRDFGRVVGTVVGTGGELKVDTGEGKTVTVKVGSQTEITLPGKASFADIAAGKFVMVQGNPEGDTIQASSVRIVGGGRGFGKGRPGGKRAASRDRKV